MSSYMELYTEVKSIMKKLQKKGCFQKYTTKDFFYFMDEKTRGILVFSEHLYKDGYGIQLFLNGQGLNYLHDILSSEGNYPINYFYSDCNLLGFVPKKDLMPDDLDFLKNNHIRLSQDYNFVPIKFKEGYGKMMMTKEDLSKALNYLYYAYALVTNEKEAIDMALENELTPLGIFSNTEMTYSVQYVSLPKLEEMPKNKPVNKAIVEDLSERVFVNDTCYFFHTYFPEHVEGSAAYKTMVIAYYKNSNKYHIELINTTPDKIDQSFMGFMDEIFNTFGKPVNVLFNHRKLYSIAFRTLSKLNIDVNYSRENGEIDQKIYEILIDNAKTELKTEEYLEEDDFELIEENEDIYVS